jgi:hypothetical protein
MADNRGSGDIVYTSQPGCLGMIGQVALVVALAAGLLVALALLIWQAALQSPLLVGVFVVLLLMMAGAFVGVVVDMQRRYAANLRDAHLAAANAHYQDRPEGQAQLQLGPGAPEARQRVELRRDFANGLPAGMSARVAVPTGQAGGANVETQADAIGAALSILRDGGQPTRAEFMARGITSSADQAAAVAAMVAWEYAEAGAGKGSAARWCARPEDADDIAAHLDAQLRRRGAALPYPVEARADARTPAQSRQAGRQAGGGAR